MVTSYVPDPSVDAGLTLAALAGLFLDHGASEPSQGLREDAALAVEDPDHVPAFASVGAMLGLFPQLGAAPEPGFSVR